MQKIEVIATPAMDLDALEEDLKKLGIVGMAVTDIHLFGDRGGVREIYRGVAHNVRHAPKLKIEILWEGDCRPVIDILKQHIRTDKQAGGKVFILPVVCSSPEPLWT